MLQEGILSNKLFKADFISRGPQSLLQYLLNLSKNVTCFLNHFAAKKCLFLHPFKIFFFLPKQLAIQEAIRRIEYLTKKKKLSLFFVILFLKWANLW